MIFSERTEKKSADAIVAKKRGNARGAKGGRSKAELEMRLKGSWEGIVDYVNTDKTKTIKTIGDNAQWFEDHMPYDAKYRKPSVTGIVANAIDVVIETGDSGPITPIGINLSAVSTFTETSPFSRRSKFFTPSNSGMPFSEPSRP